MKASLISASRPVSSFSSKEAIPTNASENCVRSASVSRRTNVFVPTSRWCCKLFNSANHGNESVRSKLLYARAYRNPRIFHRIHIPSVVWLTLLDEYLCVCESNAKWISLLYGLPGDAPSRLRHQSSAASLLSSWRFHCSNIHHLHSISSARPHPPQYR